MEGQELPVGWERCLFGDAVDYGNTKKTEPADIPDDAWVLELEDIEKNSSKLLARSTFAERKSKSTKNAFEKGAVLYGKLRPYLNKVLLADQPGFCSTEIIPLLAGEGVEAGHLFHWLKSPEFLSYTEEVSHGINMPRLGTEAGRKAPLVLAPLNELRRISAKLDTTLAAVDACRQRLDGVAAILKRFRQAVLSAATSGELTREWREERDREQDWEPSSIKSIAEVGTGSTPLRSNQSFYSVDGMPWITSAATSEELITTANEFVTESGIKAGRLQIFPQGTLLVAMYGEGKTRGQVSELGIAASINQACAAIHSPREQHLMPFIKIALKANYLEMRQLAEGGNQPNLNLSKIKDFPVRVPPKDEVFEICAQVKSLFTLADQLEARLTTARKVVDRLTPALLAKAFRGELVPQDPGDEPTSVLLERIRAARQAEAAAGKPSRRGRRKAATNPDQIAMEAAPVPGDFLAGLLRECGALSERALLAVSELEPQRFQQQLYRELESGTAREVQDNGQVLLEAVG